MSQLPEVGRPHDASMRVAHLTTVDLSLRFLLWPQLRELVDEGVEAIGISSPGPWVSEIEAAGIHHIELPSSTRGFSLSADFRTVLELWQVLRKTPLTILHTHNPKPGIYGRVLGRLLGVPVVVNTLHGFYATESDRFLKRIVVYLLEGVAARCSDAELHQNPEDLMLARRLRIVRRDRARLLGNGIDLSRFDANRFDMAARAETRAELGIAEDAVVVGSVGRLVAEKGFPELFEAFKDVAENVVLVVVGPVDPDKPDAVPEAVLEDAMSRGVRVLGMRTDVDQLYAAMDLFVLASHREGFPRAAMEAAAMGLPIIATDIRGCRQVVSNGDNGFLVPVASPLALRDAISALVKDPALRDRMGEASRNKARSSFDERRVVEIVMDTYREVLERKGLAHLMTGEMARAGAPGPPRRARPDEATQLANLHADLIGGGFLPRLGRRFLRVLYQGLLEWPDSEVFVVEDGSGLVGFVVGVADLGGFYKWFIRRKWWKAGVAALPALLKPANVRRALESLRYGGDFEDTEVAAEILSLGVAPRARGAGISSELLDAALRSLTHRGEAAVRVVVGSDNEVAIKAYEKAGFAVSSRVEVHRGESSNVLTWRSS